MSNGNKFLMESFKSWLYNKSLSAIFCVTAVVYYLSLRFIFPGYFKPLVPWHKDSFGYFSDFDEPLTFWSMFSTPRFVGGTLDAAISQLGMGGFTAVMAIISLFSISLTIYLITLIANRKINWFFIVVYLLLVFINPWFYFNYVYDIYDTFAYLFLILAFVSWYLYLKNENSGRGYLIAIIIFTILSLFSKETYFPTFALFWIFQCVFGVKKRRSAIYVTIITFVFMILSILHNKLVTSPFVDVDASTTAPYYIDLSIGSLFHVFLFYLHNFANLGSAIIVGISLILVLVLKIKWKEAVLFFAMGLSTYAPYIILPNHIFPIYSWLAVPLSYCVLLLLGTEVSKYMRISRYSFKFNTILVPIILILCFFTTSLYINKGYNNETVKWALLQEKINRNTLHAFDYMKTAIKPGDKVLISGLYTPNNPFLIPTFVINNFGKELYIDWTIAVANIAWSDKAKNPALASPYRSVEVKDIKVTDYDKIFVFNNEGILMNELTRDDVISQQKQTDDVISYQDLILFPELADFQKKYTENPKDPSTLMNIGIMYFNNNMFDRAETYFKKSITMMDEQPLIPANPYPYFFLGNIYEQQKHDLVEAEKFYAKAIELDNPQAKNVNFEEALKRVQENRK